MKIHEYQAKQIFRDAGVAVPRGSVADTPQAAADAYAALGGRMALLKSQIHAGGRGKGTIADIPGQRGVQAVHSREEAETVAGNILGHRLVTAQTGPVGRAVHRLLVEEGCPIAREFYLGVVVDRTSERPVLIASSEGGMEIEQVAAATPDRIYTEPFDAGAGLGRTRPARSPGGSGFLRLRCARPKGSFWRWAACFCSTIAACWKSTPWC